MGVVVQVASFVQSLSQLARNLGRLAFGRKWLALTKSDGRSSYERLIDLHPSTRLDDVEAQ